MNWLNHLKNMERVSRELANLARGQNSDVLGEDLEILEQIWDKRERLVAEMLMLSRKLRPVWQGWPQCLENLAIAQTEQVEQWLEQIRANAAQVLELDEQFKPELERMLQETRDELMELNHKDKALQAYKPTVLTNPQHSLPSQLSRTT